VSRLKTIEEPTMNSHELLRVVDTLHRDKDISKDIIFAAIEKAVRLAIHKSFDDEDDSSSVTVAIDRGTGEIKAQRGDKVIEPAEMGRIAAQAAKQAMIQALREEESQAIAHRYSDKKGDLVMGTVQRFDNGSATVSLGKDEALLPRSEQIPGEGHHVNERVKAIVLDVKRAGNRVKIILSRTHPDFVRRLFEEEIPEIQDGTITIRAVSREAGHRTKVAVSSIDTKVDCVGACVGVRGSRIKNIIDELGGERIDIVRWNDSLQVLIPNALQPASIEEVFLYPRLGRAIVLVKEDQLSLAIGRRGQNVRLASKLVGWDIEIMTHDELNAGIEQAETWFRTVPHVGDPQVEAFIEEGFLSFDDLTFMEPEDLGELAGLTEEQAMDIIDFAEQRSEEIEEEQAAAKAAGLLPAHGPSSAKVKAAGILGDPSLAGMGSAMEKRPAAPSEAKQAFENLFQPREASPPIGESPAAEEPLADVPVEAVMEEQLEAAGATAPDEATAAETPEPEEHAEPQTHTETEAPPA
jgi:N utilization substance protein A